MQKLWCFPALSACIDVETLGPQAACLICWNILQRPSKWKPCRRQESRITILPHRRPHALVLSRGMCFHILLRGFHVLSLCVMAKLAKCCKGICGLGLPGIASATHLRYERYPRQAWPASCTVCLIFAPIADQQEQRCTTPPLCSLTVGRAQNLFSDTALHTYQHLIGAPVKHRKPPFQTSANNILI